MKIAVACGGTGGHIFPGLSTAEALRTRGHDVSLWTGARASERAALAGWTGPVFQVRSRGLPAGFGTGSVAALATLFFSFLESRRRMRSARPDVFLAMGGHACAVPALAAVSLGVPLVLHEANVVPGRATRFLARFAKTFAIGFEETRAHIKHPGMVYTGMPLRKTRPGAAPYAEYALKPGSFIVLAMGGSRGARAINELVPAALAALRAGGRDVSAIHLAGAEDEREVRWKYDSAGVPSRVHAFLDDVSGAFRASALAVCRSGASTCAELAHFGLPAILVPYPFAASNHQLANARAVEKAGAAKVIEENALTAEKLATMIADLMDDAPGLARMRQAARGRAKDGAADRLADLVLETGEVKLK